MIKKRLEEERDQEKELLVQVINHKMLDLAEHQDKVVAQVKVEDRDNKVQTEVAVATETEAEKEE